MIAQDTGSAILGPARGDFYFGSGADAGTRAGLLRHRPLSWCCVQSRNHEPTAAPAFAQRRGASALGPGRPRDHADAGARAAGRAGAQPSPAIAVENGPNQSAAPAVRAAAVTPSRARGSAARSPRSRRLRQALRRGARPVDAVIDLHGMRQAEAHDALLRFLHGPRQPGHSLVLVSPARAGPDRATRCSRSGASCAAWCPIGCGCRTSGRS